jgi:hypothetical protein
MLRSKGEPMKKRSILRIAALLSALVLVSFPAAGTVGAASGRGSTARDLALAIAATARFHSSDQAAGGGYGPFPAGVPLHECISSFDGTGSMGFHYVNGHLLDANVAANAPEVLVYAPDQNGKRKLVALEYVVFQADWIEAHGDGMPMLFGQPFMATPFPNRYGIPAFFALHVWLYQSNPAGMFAPFNPNVSCGAAAATSSAGRTAAATLTAARLAGTVAAGPRWSCQIGSAPRSA